MEVNTEEVTSSVDIIKESSDNVPNSPCGDRSNRTDENLPQSVDTSIIDSGRDTVNCEERATTKHDERDNTESSIKDFTMNEATIDDTQGQAVNSDDSGDFSQEVRQEQEEPSSSGINEAGTQGISADASESAKENSESIEEISKTADTSNSNEDIQSEPSIISEQLQTNISKENVQENEDTNLENVENEDLENNDAVENDDTPQTIGSDDTSQTDQNVEPQHTSENEDLRKEENDEQLQTTEKENKTSEDDENDNLGDSDIVTSDSANEAHPEENQNEGNSNEVTEPDKDSEESVNRSKSPSIEKQSENDKTSSEANTTEEADSSTKAHSMELNIDTEASTSTETKTNTETSTSTENSISTETGTSTETSKRTETSKSMEANKNSEASKSAESNKSSEANKNTGVSKEVPAESSVEAMPNGIVNGEHVSEETEPSSEQGADAEMCIIPDTERVISQAEKDAASALPTLRELTESNASAESTSDVPESTSTESSAEKFTISKYDKNESHQCDQCLLVSEKKPKYVATKSGITKYICAEGCLEGFKLKHAGNFIHNEGEIRVKNFAPPIELTNVSYIRKCASCAQKISDPDVNLAWEIMDFCNEFCLSKYQKEIGSRCSSCNTDVRPNSLGKYCVRFGNDIRQFCSSHCLEEYKKGLKVCSYCQQDISKGSEGFLAPVGDKGHFKDFCSQNCMEKYDIMTNERAPVVEPGTKCCVCQKTDIAIEFEFKNQKNHFCSEPCFVAFSFVNQISAGKCAMCRRNFLRSTLEKHTMFYDNVQHSFCTNSCRNIFIIANRKIVPCNWCKVKKYNFDMIRRYSTNNEVLNMCSVNCYSLYRVSVNAVQSKKITCDFCRKNMQSLYHLTMSDATIRNFCSYSCVMSFQSQFPKTPITINASSNVPIVPTGGPKSTKRLSQGNRTEDESSMPVISNVQSLATTNGTVNPVGITTRTTRSKSNLNSATTVVPNNLVEAQTIQSITSQIKQQVIVKPYPVPEQRNVGTLVRTRCFTKGTQCTPPTTCDKQIQTEKRAKDKILIPVPVPIYVPTPMHMYTAPTIIPVPIPVPIPIPIFIPTTRNSANGIMKEIKKIQVKIPSDPYEAELLMMAEMVADDKKEENTDSESDIDDNTGADEGHFSPEPVDASNTFGDDMLQMALKMATELEEPAVDLEGALTANTITAQQGEGTNAEHVEDSQPMHLMERQPMRGRKRGMRQGGRNATPSKRGRRVSNQPEIPVMPPVQPPPPPEPVEKPDANMCLKYTFGVNAWKQWVTTKNSELEKSSRRVKLFKTEILQLTSDELNYSLCLFVKEVRKPNGAEYAPDTIYYLCLGIQQYLFENGRIDNIFCDPYYEKFTDCLDEVAKKFSVLYNDSHYIVTRVEEEHLWESKQLGAHSPHVLLSTLMFFNTKHFNLTTVDEHMQLSFSHIMKHWKRNPSQPGAAKVPGSRNVLLRFYPPQSALQNNTRKKKVYEQQENEENPLRCPVKLYEFYLSKCPESVKTRNDVFYLQPERSCVPDSPVWYSTMPLPREALEKMLHRVKMVKEINVALLTS